MYVYACKFTSIHTLSIHICDHHVDASRRCVCVGGRMDFAREIFCPNLQARFCKLYPAGFSVVIYLLLCSQLSGFVCVSFGSKIPPWSFANRVGRISGSAKRAGFWRYDPSKKSPQALCTSNAILDFHILEITNLLGLLNCNRQNRQDRACRI